jgi:hypothetical protein
MLPTDEKEIVKHCTLHNKSPQTSKIREKNNFWIKVKNQGIPESHF